MQSQRKTRSKVISLECFPRSEFKRNIERAMNNEMDNLEDTVDWINDKLNNPNFEMTGAERDEAESYKRRVESAQDEVYEMLEKIKKIPVCEPPAFLPY